MLNSSENKKKRIDRNFGCGYDQNEVLIIIEQQQITEGFVLAIYRKELLKKFNEKCDQLSVYNNLNKEREIEQAGIEYRKKKLSNKKNEEQRSTDATNKVEQPDSLKSKSSISSS